MSNEQVEPQKLNINKVEDGKVEKVEKAIKTGK